MGTRALIRVFDDAKAATELVCIYRQFDGCVEGLGADIAGILRGKSFVNGIGGDRAVFNGMGCFAAQLIGGLKAGKAGNVYVYPVGSKDVGEEYVYEIRGAGYRDPANVIVTVTAYDKQEFSGTVAEFIAFVENYANADTEGN